MITPPLRIEGHCEAKKHSYRQTQDGVVISFVVHPNDVSPALAAAALGTIFMLAYAEVVEGQEAATAAPEAVEQAKERRPFHELPLAQQAALLCQDARFRHWAARWDGLSKDLTEDQAAVFVRAKCGVESRADIVRNPDAAEKFLAMVAAYRIQTGMETWTR